MNDMLKAFWITLSIMSCIYPLTGEDLPRARLLFGGDTLLGGYYHSERYGTMTDMLTPLDSLLNRCGAPCAADYYFQNLNNIIRSSDLFMVNLEGPITGPIPPSPGDTLFLSKAIPLRQHESTAVILAAAGIDLVTLANNHMCDYDGWNGLKTTLDSLKSVLPAVGAGPGDQAYTGYHTELNGIPFSFFGATDVVDPWCSVPPEGYPGLAVIPDTINYDINPHLNILLKNIAEAKLSDDVVVVYIHFGPFRGPNINRRQEELADILIGAGVDIVIGSSSHTAQAIQEFRDEEGRIRQLVFFGLGNLVFGGRRSPQDPGMLASVTCIQIDEGLILEYSPIMISPNPHRSFIPQIISN